MLKWSPEPFDTEPVATASPIARAEDFEATGTAVVETTGTVGDTLGDTQGFRREAGFTDTKSLMNSLTSEERSQVYELVELDLIEGYKIREQEMVDEYDTRLAEMRSESERRMEMWSQKISDAVATEVKEAASASARLAVQMAEKIVRQTVVANPEILARAIETTLFKISENTPLTVRTHPDEAAWLDQHTALKDRLNIEVVVADRRVDQGGCVINCGGREWDATLPRQMGNLAEIVEEMIATAVNPDLDAAIDTTTSETNNEPESLNEPEVDDVPGVE